VAQSTNKAEGDELRRAHGKHVGVDHQIIVLAYDLASDQFVHIARA